VATKEKTKGGYIPLYYDSGAINGTAENDLFIHSCNFGLLLEKQHPFHYPGDHDKLSDSIYYHHVALSLLACLLAPALPLGNYKRMWNWGEGEEKEEDGLSSYPHRGNFKVSQGERPKGTAGNDRKMVAWFWWWWVVVKLWHPALSELINYWWNEWVVEFHPHSWVKLRLLHARLNKIIGRLN
jgi:hypothetical protein